MRGGSIPSGLLVARAFFKTDIRGAGSGNIGAANALRTLGKGAGAAVLLLDALKGFVPVLCAEIFFSDEFVVALVCGFAAVAGHCYSPWLRGRGGKGVATALGALFAIAWAAGLIFIAIWLAAALLTRYASVASLTATLLSIASLWYFIGPAGGIYGALVAAIVVWRHRENLARLRAGTENRLRAAASSQPGA